MTDIETSGDGRFWACVMVASALVGLAGVTFPAIADKKLSILRPEIRQSDQVERASERGFSELNRERYLEAYAWSARIKLESLSLHHGIRVNVTEDKMLLASGNIPQNISSRYRLFKQWYSLQEGFPPLLEEVSFSELTITPPALKSVWFHEPATAFFEDGTSGEIGGLVGEGWKILDIQPDELVLYKNGNTFLLQF
ncbi:MAG: hypothetical protein AAF423_10765 [Pseudomonadota bacterium]